jgi:chitinase
MKTSLLLLGFLFLLVESKREPKFAPYIYTGMDLVGLHQKYGLKAVTLAFVLAKGGCHPSWDGQTAIDDNDAISKIKAFEAVGGHVIVATGGAEGTYLEKTCTSASALAGAYKHALTVTGSTHLDLDIEKAIPTDMVAQAVAEVQKENPAITFSLTIGADDSGITAQGMTILRSAVKHGVNVDIVNAMAMDFQSAKAWGGAIVDLAEATHKQLKQIWPNKSDQELYSMIGLTPMIGRNDEGKAFTPDDAHKVVEYAKSKGIGHLAFWALGRDNGKCPNESGNPSDECSGIKQSDHEFTQIFSQFDK